MAPDTFDKKQLLELEPYPEDLKMRIQQEIAATRERPLKPWERWLLGAGGVALAGVILYKLSLLGREGQLDTMPVWCQSLFGGFLLFGCCGLAYIAQTLKRGTTRPLDGRFLLYAGTALVTGKILTEIYLRGAISGLGVVAGLVIVAALAYARAEAVEFRLRERQLLTELALAELAEKVVGRLQNK